MPTLLVVAHRPHAPARSGPFTERAHGAWRPCAAMRTKSSLCPLVVRGVDQRPCNHGPPNHGHADPPAPARHAQIPPATSRTPVPAPGMPRATGRPAAGSSTNSRSRRAPRRRSNPRAIPCSARPLLLVEAERDGGCILHLLRNLVAPADPLHVLGASGPPMPARSPAALSWQAICALVCCQARRRIRPTDRAGRTPAPRAARVRVRARAWLVRPARPRLRRARRASAPSVSRGCGRRDRSLARRRGTMS